MYYPHRRSIKNPNMEHALSVMQVLRDPLAADPKFAKVMAGLLTTKEADGFDIIDPYNIPDVFVPGPIFVGLGSDTDCDGTTFHAVKIEAANLAEAYNKVTDERVYEIVSLAEADRRDIWPEPTPKWSERAYFMTEGYCSLGANWNPWVYDDTLGTVLDHSMDEPVISDDDIDAYNMGLL